MDDRVSRYPGRVKLTPVEGQENVYDMVLADEPITTGTRLNKANLLSDQVATLIGLNTSAVPDDMFNVLATAGDLHVWRRTVETSDKIPAKYTLGSATSLTIATTTDKRYTVTSYYSSEISVSDNGEVIAPTGSKTNIGMDGSNLTFVNANLTNCFIRYEGTREDGGLTVVQGVYFIPGDAAYSVSGNTLRVSKSQKVTGVPAVPPGTYTDYPVSVNRNAYRESSTGEGIPAGWVLGEEETKTVLRLNGTGVSTQYCFYGNRLTAEENGIIKINNETKVSFDVSTGDISSLQSVLPGKFCRFSIKSPQFASEILDGVWYVLPLAKFSVSSGNKGYLSVDKIKKAIYQPAIPAGTTIEYLGKLGDKSRMQIVSYVGTGTNGPSSPCTVNAEFPFRVAIFIAGISGSYGNIMTNGNVLCMDFVSVSYKILAGSSVWNEMYVKKGQDNKSLSYYSTRSPSNQFNASGYTYYLALLS